MADPISITTGVLSLVAAALKISQNLMTLQTKFQRAPETVSSLVREFQAISVGLSQLNLLLKKRGDILQVGTSEVERAQLLQCFDAMVLDMARTFSILNVELDKLNRGEARPLALRMRFLWAESDLVEYTTRIRDQRSSLAFIMQIIQLIKTSDIHRELHSDSPGLSALKRTASKANQSRAPPISSLSTSHAGVTGESQAEPLNLDGILRRDTAFPDVDSIATARPADTTVPRHRQPQGRASTAEQMGGGPCPPTAGNIQGGGAPAAAAAEKITPTIVFHELHYYVAANDINRVIMLLDLKHDPLGLPHDPYGSLPNAKKSSLSLAAYLGREEIMTIFLDRGLAWAINKLIGTDLPPFLGAAYAGHESMVRLLLARGANPRLRGPGDATALFWSSSRGHVGVVNLLLSTPAKGDINLSNAKGLTPLMVASQHRRGTQVVRILLANGADPTMLNAKGQSALHLACHAGHSAAIGLLLAHCAQSSAPDYVNAATSNGKTPLIFASLSGHADLCGLLLAAGALPDSQDVDGKTALYHASCHGHGEVVETLLARGMSSETTTLQGDTALHIACERGHARAVGALLAHGARLETPRASDGMSALEIAIWYRRREILDPLILFQTQRDPDRFSKETALYAAAEWGLTETMDALIEAGADINALDGGGGQTLLARAVREGKHEAVACLISKGAEVDKADRFGSTPLHRVARGGNLDVVELLLGADADVEGRDGKGLTPLHVAAVYGTKEMVEVLVRRGGACVGAVSETCSSTDSSCGQAGGAHQMTVLMMAAENRRKDVVEKLIGLGALPREPKGMSPYKLRDDNITFVADTLGNVEIVFQLDEL